MEVIEKEINKLIKEHGDVFPDDYTEEDIIAFCIQWVNANIEDVYNFLWEDCKDEYQ